jgi:hypothetical protein
MYRNFIQLVSETVDDAHSKGINLFYESLEETINKNYVIESEGYEKLLTSLFEGDENSNESDIEELE